MIIRFYTWICLCLLSFLVGSIFSYESQKISQNSLLDNPSYALARNLVGYRFGSCYSFAIFWQKITGKKCQRIKTNIGTWHYICPVNEELKIWTDSNWELGQEKIRIFLKK